VINETLDTNPDLLALHQLNPGRYPYLLQSTLPSETLGRYDILFAFPGTRIEQRDDARGPFLERLRQAIPDEKPGQETSSNAELPFYGGWFLFLSYELAGEIERLPALRNDPTIPIAMATRIPVALVYSHRDNRTHVVAETDDAHMRTLIDTVHHDLQHAVPVGNEPIEIDALEEEPPQQYLDAVNTAKRYIRDGDIFQANLSRQWRASIGSHTSATSLFARLGKSNPSPFAGLAHINEQTAIVSSSPERLLEVRGKTIRTRPIAGTHPRLGDSVADHEQSARLLAHPKERAEHIMLIDLERNDLGRVCQPGSVKVPELMALETYKHVHHIVSEVSGTLRDDVDAADIIAATFPGGTITGCPKVRCMEIIAELEQGARGAYTGSMGYLNHDGSIDLNILIRTMVLTGHELRFRAGAGIVADSIPERELEETRAKAEGLLRALETR